MAFNADRRCGLACGLKTVRRRVGFSAAQAADLISLQGIPCTRGTLLAWERGSGPTSREPFASDLPIIAEIYNCSVSDFFLQGPPDADPGAQEIASLAG